MSPTSPIARTHLFGASVRTRTATPLRLADGHEVTAELVTFDGLADGRDHVALVLGDGAATSAPLVRLHSECLVGDVFGSARCDCALRLREAARIIAGTGGVLLYLRQVGCGVEPTGDGPGSSATATAAAQMLAALGVTEPDLLTDHPDEARRLRCLGIDVRFVRPVRAVTTGRNVSYLRSRPPTAPHVLGLAG
ncbi:GTP cyclohydrolase [Streptomyces sp. NPDC051985]|uniref:GTP cyclohydrolase n=1 Tax=Streptomyces sp. NPDC051985 TaxID=3155807 RepID=UPI003442C68B